MAKKKKEQTKEEANKAAKLAESVISKINTLAAAGFGLVAALAWNDAIKAAFTLFFPKPEESVWAQFIYAFVITIIVVIITIILGKYSNKISQRVTGKKAD